MRRTHPLLLLVILAYPHPAGAQDPPSILSQVVSRHDWEIGAAGDVRVGSVALVHAADDVCLEVRGLRSTLPPVRRPSMVGFTPSFTGDSLLVSDFARSNRTPLGGFFGVFQRSPSVGDATVDRMADGRRALELTCRTQAAGFCGLWIQLYDFEVTPDARRYLDARPFSTLSFWIRGREGGERLLLKVADAEWEQREDAVPIAEVSEFLASGRVDTVWQRAVVPMDRLPSRIRRDRLAMITLETTVRGVTTVEVGPVAFSLTRDALPALPSPEAELLPSDLVRHRATWVWNTAELIRAPEPGASLLDFLEREGFDHVFLQLPGVPERQRLPGELAIDTDAMRPLVAAFTARGMRVYALDGYARYPLPEFHAGVLATIDHVARYNERVLPNERFYGVRYDIEPYLLPAFHGSGRARLLAGLLELTAASVERAHAGGLVYGADIPFWYDQPSDATYERVTVEFNGVEKPVSEHVIDLVDDIAILDYRTSAYGADGTIRHGSGELAYAAARQKPVFIALDTYALPDEVLVGFQGEPRPGLPTSPITDAIVVLASRGDSIYVAFVPEPSPGRSSLDALTRWVEGHRLDAREVWWWPRSTRVEVPARKITFADLGPELLEDVMRATAEEFRRYESFVGFAIHHAQSYQALKAR